MCSDLGFEQLCVIRVPPLLRHLHNSESDANAARVDSQVSVSRTLTVRINVVIILGSQGFPFSGTYVSQGA